MDAGLIKYGIQQKYLVRMLRGVDLGGALSNQNGFFQKSGSAGKENVMFAAFFLHFQNLCQGKNCGDAGVWF